VLTFSDSFTFSIWIRPRSFNLNSRIIDFGNGPNSNNFVLGLSYQSTGVSFVDILNGIHHTILFALNKTLVLGMWQHFAFTFSNLNANIYINGVLVDSRSSPSAPSNVSSFN